MPGPPRLFAAAEAGTLFPELMPGCLPPSGRLNALSLERNIPVSVTIELTRRCRLSCLHCYLPETRGRAAPGPELDTAGWERILGELARAGGLYLVFTGGEPLLRPDLPRLCRRAKKLNFDVRIFSSGIGMTGALAAEFRDAGVSGFELSLYGAAEVHDGITGRRGSCAETLRAAGLLAGAGVRVKLKVPLMRQNSGQTAFLRRLAAREGYAIGFDPVIAPANDGYRAGPDLRLAGAALAETLAEIPGGEGGAVTEGPAPDFVCGAGRNVCALDPAGNLYPCLQLPVRLGSLASGSFSELWSRQAWLKKWRRAGVNDIGACTACPDRDYCSFCPGISLLEEGNPLVPNRPACELARALRRRAAAGGGVAGNKVP